MQNDKTDLGAFLDQYFDNTKKSITQTSSKGLYGRIIYGQKADDFKSLSQDLHRPIVLAIDSDGLKNLTALTPFEQLLKIGYCKSYIKQKLETGHQFKWVVFEMNLLAPANWRGLFGLIKELYPDVYPDCLRHEKALKSLTKFELTPHSNPKQGHFLHAIERLAGYTFQEADKKEDPCFMSLEAYQKSHRNLYELRAFFYHTLHLRELYSGDGFTYNEYGKRELREYILPNKRIEAIPGARLIDLNVRLPS